MKKLDISNLRIIRNYVLVKPDPNYTTYQFKGNETGIIAPDHIMENGKAISVKERNYSVYGTVYAVPDKIDFNRDKIKHIIDRHDFVTEHYGETIIADNSKFEEVARIRKNSCLFGTANEIEKGDRVKFSYQSHMEAIENGAIIDTDHGLMYFIKYDKMFMVVNEDLSPKRMLNGYILVDPDINEVKSDGIMNYTESEAGLVIPSLKTKEKRSRKKMTGKVVLAGTPIRGYLQFGELEDNDDIIEPGDHLLFDPRGCKRLEHHNHQEYSDKTYYLIQRRDVYLNRRENAIFEEIEV